MADQRDLTTSELAVVRLLVEAKTNYEIAQELGVSEATVKRHLNFIQIKWDAPNRVGIAVKAVRDGVVK